MHFNAHPLLDPSYSSLLNPHDSPPTDTVVLDPHSTPTDLVSLPIHEVDPLPLTTTSASANPPSPLLGKEKRIKQPSSRLQGYITNTIQLFPKPVMTLTSPSPTTRSSGRQVLIFLSFVM